MGTNMLYINSDELNLASNAIKERWCQYWVSVENRSGQDWVCFNVTDPSESRPASWSQRMKGIPFSLFLKQHEESGRVVIGGKQYTIVTE